MKKLIRRIIRWAYGYDLDFTILLIENRQDNLRIMLEDYISSQVFKQNAAKGAEEK